MISFLPSSSKCDEFHLCYKLSEPHRSCRRRQITIQVGLLAICGLDQGLHPLSPVSKKRGTKMSITGVPSEVVESHFIWFQRPPRPALIGRIDWWKIIRSPIFLFIGSSKCWAMRHRSIDRATRIDSFDARNFLHALHGQKVA